MLKLIMRPGLHVIRSLPIGKKFLLIFVLYLIPAGYVTFYTVGKNSQALSVARQEVDELKLINLFRQGFVSIATVRGLTNAYLNGDVTVKSKIDTLAFQVDSQFKLIRSNKSFEYLLASQKKKWADIIQAWSLLKQEASRLEAKDSFKRYSVLLSNILSLTSSIKELGTLMIDSERETSFLIKYFIEELPTLSEIVGQTRGIGAGVAARKKFTSDSFIALSNKHQQILVFKRQFFDSFENAVNNDALLRPLLGKLEKLKANINNFTTLTREKLLDPDEILIASAAYFELGTGVIQEILKLQELLYQQLLSSLNEREQQLLYEIGVNIISSLALLVGGIYLFSCFYRNILDSISEIKGCVNAVAEGDLTQRVDIYSNDEMKVIGDDINKMVENTRVLVGEVLTTTDELVATAEHSNVNAVNTRKRISEQNVEVEQVATAMNQMSATVQEVAGNAEQTAVSSASADKDSKQGLDILKSTTGSINELAGELDIAVSSINELQTNVNGIGSVLDVIQGIADQTNLLALNAAIEAARAGESGRGFAVVADEVRSLASKTQESTEEIRQMIDKLQRSAGLSVNAMISGNEKSQHTVEEAKKAATALNQISDSVGHISLMSEQIASAATEQSVVAEEVNKSVNNVKDISQLTEQAALDSEKSSHFLNEVSANLKVLIARFKTE